MTDTIRQPPTPPTPDDAAERRRQLLQLALFVVLMVIIAALNGGLVVLAVVASLIVVVMLHELGHLVTAKWAGMKVTEYFLGFGPRLWSIRRGETEYGVKALPLGGYVRIVGMSNLEKVDPADEARSYREQSFPRRLMVVCAGSFMHFLIAFVLLFLAATAVGAPKVTSPPRVATVVHSAADPAPAERAGFRPGDRIVAVDGQPATNWEDVKPYIQHRAGTPITFVVDRDGTRLTLTATPEETEQDGKRVGVIGITAASHADRANPIVGLGRAGRELASVTRLTVTSLGTLFGPGHLESYADQITNKTPQGGGTRQADRDRPVSIVGAVRLTSEAAGEGWYLLLFLLAALNVFIGVLNMVPLPPLDGGHVAVAVYERIRSRHGRRYHADASKLVPVAAATLAVLLVLGGALIWLDIFRPVSLQ